MCSHGWARHGESWTHHLALAKLEAQTGGIFYGKKRMQLWKCMSLHLADIHHLLCLAFPWCWDPQCWHASLREVKRRSDSMYELEQKTSCLLYHFLIPPLSLSCHTHTSTLVHIIKTPYFWGTIADKKWGVFELPGCFRPFFSSCSLSSPAGL